MTKATYVALILFPIFALAIGEKSPPKKTATEVLSQAAGEKRRAAEKKSGKKRKLPQEVEEATAIPPMPAGTER